MRRTAIIVFLLVPAWSVVPAGAQDSIAAALNPMLSAARVPGARWPDFARYRDVLNRLYEVEGFGSLWLDSTGISPQAEAAIAALLTAGDHGLDPRGLLQVLLLHR